MATRGSSPRVRGKHPRRPRTGRGRGLIPARAGKTTRRPRGRGCPWAHPHACGENLSRSSLTFVSWGSSPRVRGKRLRLLAQTRTRRLIPARAGKTAMRTGAGADTGAHPRACGENWEGWGTALKPAGSSPRVRGKLSGRLPAAASAGLIPARAGKTGHEEIMKIPGLWLIPARAGKTSGGWSSPCAWSAHPRACGENSPHYFHKAPAAGSSPRVRGKRDRREAERQPQRLIPARAGKTRISTLIGEPPWAHPRACGENAAVIRAMGRPRGSSPRVRGKRPHPRRRRGPVRLIPARAGKTAPASSASSSGSAHPRTCGEKQRTLRYPRHQAGSSPRVRGKLREGDHPGLPALAHPRACGENLIGLGADLAATGSSPRVRGKL